MAHPETDLFAWRKSTYSSAQSQCVEIAGNVPRIVAIRDSKNPRGPAQLVSRDAWRTFVRFVASSPGPDQLHG